MTIETKFNPNDEVWIMLDNKPTKCFVKGISIYIGNDQYRTTAFNYKDHEVTERYVLLQILGENKGHVICSSSDSTKEKYFRVEDLFPTKETLLKSL